MKHSAGFGKLPWDMVVFLSITTIGLGVSFKRLAYPGKFAEASQVQSVEREIDLVKTDSLGVVDLGCLDRKAGNERLTFEGANIRFKGKFCNLTRTQLKVFDGIRVKNLSNGFEGTVFFQGSGAHFVSDFINLQRGKNVVQLQWKESKNAETETLLAEVFEK